MPPLRVEPPKPERLGLEEADRCAAAGELAGRGNPRVATADHDDIDRVRELPPAPVGQRGHRRVPVRPALEVVVEGRIWHRAQRSGAGGRHAVAAAGSCGVAHAVNLRPASGINSLNARRVTPIGPAIDRSVVDRARNGDLDAFESIVRGRMDAVYRLTSAILGDEADARDAAQETFVAAWRELPRLRDPDKFEAWLQRVAVNASRMTLRARGRRRVREIPSSQVAALASHAAPGGADDDAGLLDARASPPHDRPAVDPRPPPPRRTAARGDRGGPRNSARDGEVEAVQREARARVGPSSRRRRPMTDDRRPTDWPDERLAERLPGPSRSSPYPAGSGRGNARAGSPLVSAIASSARG